MNLYDRVVKYHNNLPFFRKSYLIEYPLFVVEYDNHGELVKKRMDELKAKNESIEISCNSPYDKLSILTSRVQDGVLATTLMFIDTIRCSFYIVKEYDLKNDDGNRIIINNVYYGHDGYSAVGRSRANRNVITDAAELEFIDRKFTSEEMIDLIKIKGSSTCSNSKKLLFKNFIDTHGENTEEDIKFQRESTMEDLSIFYGLTLALSLSTDHFLVQARNAKLKNNYKENINSSYSARTKYRLITAKEFRYLTKTKDPEGSKSDHYRRGHWRHYTSNFYVNKKGEKKWIDALWVGDSEATLEGIKYKVMLDL